MIQRQQTLWLLLSAISSLLSFMFPFVTGKLTVNEVTEEKTITAGSEFILLILTGLMLIIAAVTIFLYKNRKQQLTLCIIGTLLSAGVIFLYIMEVRKLTTSTLALASILPFLALLGFILAWRNIRKDEKLIKSLDKLR
jgi:cytochrome c biogenesis factor